SERSLDKMRIFLLTLILCLTLVEAAEWKCGATKWDSTAFITAVALNCPARSIRLNRCCVDHDACYTRRIGRSPCDNEFERCAKMAVEGAPMCMLAVKVAVKAVRIFGEKSYRSEW
ncbi:hypothetical protein PFISCL1PPCAC_23096, partial [Pristionchus fissidentatus]